MTVKSKIGTPEQPHSFHVESALRNLEGIGHIIGDMAGSGLTANANSLDFLGQSILDIHNQLSGLLFSEQGDEGRAKA